MQPNLSTPCVTHGMSPCRLMFSVAGCYEFCILFDVNGDGGVVCFNPSFSAAQCTTGYMICLVLVFLVLFHFVNINRICR